MKIEELQKALEKEDVTYKGICHDCKNPVEVEVTKVAGKITITGGAVFKIKQGLETSLFLKCDECFKRDKILRNFKETEVFSRSVGYLRPVKQWNAGKREEFRARKLFINTKGL